VVRRLITVSASPQRAPVADSYDRYYGSGVYDARYPQPSPATYRSVLRLARTAERILDFGAGSGRYALPILLATDAFVCTCSQIPVAQIVGQAGQRGEGRVFCPGPGVTTPRRGR
jgi:hypothetical protein